VLLTSLAMVLRARDLARGRLARGTASFPLPENDKKDDSRPVEPTASAESSLATTELRLLHAFLPGVSALDLEMVLARGLEAAAEVGSASAAVIVLPRRAETPLIATFGLTSADSWHDRVGLPPNCGQARAVELAYSYSESATAWDAFLLRNGLAVPIPSGGDKLGTLAIYWRRLQHQVSEQELNHLEAVARALASALKIVIRLEEARPFELDGHTGLLNARAMRQALGRECARARRYERPVAFILAQLELPLTKEALASAGHILGAAIRTVDLPCYLGEGSFAVILPEAALVDAQRLHRRLEAALASGLDGLPHGSSHIAILELRDDEDAVSFLDRAERELMRAAQDGTHVIGQASCEPDLARA
jgi:GGDEF domain-containing protein